MHELTFTLKTDKELDAHVICELLADWCLNADVELIELNIHDLKQRE